MKHLHKTIVSIFFALLLTFTAGFSVFATDTTTVSALPTASSVLVNGSPVSFQAYNIGGYNYFKLRDLGKALNGTAKQFEVGFDSANNAITVTTGKSYTQVGGELVTSGNTAQQADVSKATVFIDGKKADLSAYTIGGYNYFKLRDLGAAVNFSVNFNNETKNIEIDTTKDSDGTAPKASNPLVGAWHFDMTAKGVKTTAYLIFNEDGTIKQFLGSEVATFKLDASAISITNTYDGATSKYAYSITAGNGQTTLNIPVKNLGQMARDGLSTETGAAVVYGLWKSIDNYYSDGTHFYFTKDSRILIGIVLNGQYKVSESGNSFDDTITDDGTYETTKFKIETVDGTTKLICTDSNGNQTIMYKE